MEDICRSVNSGIYSNDNHDFLFLSHQKLTFRCTFKYLQVLIYTFMFLYSTISFYVYSKGGLSKIGRLDVSDNRFSLALFFLEYFFDVKGFSTTVAGSRFRNKVL